MSEWLMSPAKNGSAAHVDSEPVKGPVTNVEEAPAKSRKPGGKLNVANRTIFTDSRGEWLVSGKRNDNAGILDNLHFMRGMNSECVDLIYLDPPFNSNKRYSAPIGGGGKKQTAFSDTWTMDAVKAGWADKIAVRNPGLWAVLEAAKAIGRRSDRPYLIYMAVRLMEMHRLLKPDGSIYLHCDPIMSHWLKLVMDAIFRGGFRNEIVWRCTTGVSGFKTQAMKWIRNHDLILYYVKNPHDFVYHKAYRPHTEKNLGRTDRPPNPLGVRIDDSWVDIGSMQQNASAREKTGYGTQKPLDLLLRIIKASSSKGDVVLDPFCGCATTCVAAESLGRQWVGMDISPVACDMVKKRLKKELFITVGKTKREGVLELSKTLSNGKKDKYKAFHRVRPATRTDAPLMNLRIATVKNAAKDRLYRLQGGNCNGCGHQFNDRNLAIDHIIPQSLGGGDIPTNLQLLCTACNSEKGVRTMDEFVAQRIKNSDSVRKIAAKEYREKEQWEMGLEQENGGLL